MRRARRPCAPPPARKQRLLAGRSKTCGSLLAKHFTQGAGPARRRATRRSRVGTPQRRAARACHGWRGAIPCARGGGQGPGALLRMALPRDLSCQTTATCRDGWGPTSLRTEWTEGRLALETVPQLLAVLTQLALGLLLLLKPRLLANVLRRPQAAGRPRAAQRHRCQRRHSLASKRSLDKASLERPWRILRTSPKSWSTRSSIKSDEASRAILRNGL